MRYLYIILLLLLASVASAQVPIVINPTKSNIGSMQALLGGNVTSIGGFPVTNRGIFWGLSTDPSTNEHSTSGTTGIFSIIASGMPSGTFIYYRAFAFNAQGFGFTTSDSFYTDPLSGPYHYLYVNGTENCEIVWKHDPSAAGVIIIIRQDAAALADPQDGVTYTANPVFGLGQELSSGDYVAYIGTDSDVVITGLTKGTTYHVKGYSYAGSGATINYNTDAIMHLYFTTIGGQSPTLHHAYRERYCSHGYSGYNDRYNTN